MSSRTKSYQSSVTVQTENPYKCRRDFRIDKQGEKIDFTPVLISCSGCGRYALVNPSCGLRNCPRCMKRRSRKLERKYLPSIMAHQNKRGSMWSFVTLTGIRVPSLDRSYIQRFTECATRFLQSEYAQAGLGVVEHKLHVAICPVGDALSSGDFYGIHFEGPATLIHYEKSLYVHYHALVYGGFKELYGMASRWFSALLEADLITLADDTRGDRRRSVGLSVVRNLKRSVSYILKYVSKGVELSDAEVEVLKRLKYVRAWGFLYNAKEPSYDLICEDCGGKCFPTIYFDPIEYSDPPPERKLTIRLLEKVNNILS